LIPEKDTPDLLKVQVKDKQGIIDRMLKRVYYERAQKKTEDQKKKDEEAERNAMAMIDWHDFEIVQVIEYEDEEVQIPEETEDVKTEEKIEEEDMDLDMDVGEEEFPKTDMKVRGYNPRQQLPNAPGSEISYITPLGQVISEDELNSHLKVALTDPMSVEKRRIEELNERDSSLVEGIEVERNLKLIAEKRTDIFGDEELLDFGRGVGEEKKKKTSKTIWDGHSSSIGQTTRELQINKQNDNPPNPPQNQNMQQQMGPPPGRFPPPRGPMPPPGVFPMPGYPLGPPPMMRQMGERPELEGQPPTKKQKLGEGGPLVQEKEWLETHPGPLLIVIQTPDLEDKSTWNLRGQLLRIPVLMSDKVKVLKDKIAEQIGGMPPNKQKLKGEIGFWKDNKTLAYYNATNGMILELGIKERGGRKTK